MPTRLLLAGLFLLALAFPVFAQSNVIVNYKGSATTATQVSPTNPLPVTGGGSGGSTIVQPLATTTTTAASTITLTNTFQAALASSSTRKGCLVQNTGTHVQYFYFGTISSATTSNALQVQPGQTISCVAGVVVLTDDVNITGTSGDGYVVTSQ